MEIELLVSRDRARELSDNCQNGHADFDKVDPYSDILPSLLSAEDIRRYAEATGFIAPFYIGGETKSRLKKAAYEGRIGDAAYMFDQNARLIQVFTPLDEQLRVPANSIIFVECDIDFRLPEYIAARFNLQIIHVHRGLLLGTGPLIDPGFRGRLCIPLHNLTDNDYFIWKNEGLIWLEFTKTTSKLDARHDPIGRPPLGEQEFWDIRDFLVKASRQEGQQSELTPIRSSLPRMFESATQDAEEAAKNAAHAESHAGSARKEATTAQASLKKFTRTVIGFLGFGGLLVLIGLFSLFLEITNTIDRHYDTLEQLRMDVSRFEARVDQLDTTSQGRSSLLENFTERLEFLTDDDETSRP